MNKPNWTWKRRRECDTAINPTWWQPAILRCSYSCAARLREPWRRSMPYTGITLFAPLPRAEFVLRARLLLRRLLISVEAIVMKHACSTLLSRAHTACILIIRLRFERGVSAMYLSYGSCEVVLASALQAVLPLLKAEGTIGEPSTTSRRAANAFVSHIQIACPPC